MTSGFTGTWFLGAIESRIKFRNCRRYLEVKIIVAEVLCDYMGRFQSILLISIEPICWKAIQEHFGNVCQNLLAADFRQ